MAVGTTTDTSSPATGEALICGTTSVGVTVEVMVLISDVVTSNVFVRVIVVLKGLLPKSRGTVTSAVVVIFVVNVEVVRYVVSDGYTKF